MNVTEISGPELKARLDAGLPTLLIDVRQPEEFAAARIDGSTLIPIPEFTVRVPEINPEPGTLVVTICHHGVRSYKAAMYLMHVGLEPVASLAGGIDAWSLGVDSAVPRY